LILWKKY